MFDKRIALLQRLHVHHFHQEIGKRRVSRLAAHVRPALLPALERILDVKLRLLGGDFTALAVDRGAQIHFIHAVVHRIAAHQLDAVAV